MDIVAVLSISFAGVVSIISTIQNSKCDIIDCGCMKLHRKVELPTKDWFAIIYFNMYKGFKTKWIL